MHLFIKNSFLKIYVTNLYLQCVRYLFFKISLVHTIAKIYLNKTTAKSVHKLISNTLLVMSHLTDKQTKSKYYLA